MLLHRLRWPVRLTRWMAARQLATLFESEEFGDLARQRFLFWIADRQLESEVVSGLAVLLCAKYFALPSLQVLRTAINRHSIASASLLSTIYGRALEVGSWLNCHSGPSSSGFETPPYFDKYHKAHCAQKFGLEFEYLTKLVGLPFMRQWAYEWDTLMRRNEFVHSEYPHYFVNSHDGSQGVGGQFDQRQSDVFRSAYLRTLAFAVDKWDMPLSIANNTGELTLPLNTGLSGLNFSSRPAWLGDIPDLCCSIDEIEPAIRELVTQFQTSHPDTTLVDLRVPFGMARSEYGALSVSAILVSQDYEPPEPDHELWRTYEWSLPNDVSMEGELSPIDIDGYEFRGSCGMAIPVCIHLFPKPFGYWQSDIFMAGVSLPAPYCFSESVSLVWSKGSAVLETASEACAYYSTWLDQWAPVAMEGGVTRCGFVTSMKSDRLENVMTRKNLRLAWKVVIEEVDQSRDTADGKLISKIAYFAH